MKSVVNVNFSEFTQRLDTVVSRVKRGTKKATRAACEEILEMSRAEVPQVTGTLANSAFYHVEGSYVNFTGVVGYGDPNLVNPKRKQHVSDYMVAVHEDLSAVHPIGKAKFLEDPVRRYSEIYAGRASVILSKEVGW